MAEIRTQYNATAPTLQDGQWTNPQVDANGRLITKTVLADTSGNAVSVPDTFVVTLSTDTSIYTDGDVLADTQLISANFFSAAGVDRMLTNVVVLDKADQGFGMDLIFLNTNVTLGTENSPPSITDTDAASIAGIVNIYSSDWIDLGGNRVAVKTNIAQILRSVTGNLYIAAIVRGAGTYGAADIVVTLGGA